MVPNKLMSVSIPIQLPAIKPSSGCVFRTELFTPRSNYPTIPFYENIAREKDFVNGDFDTSYIETHPHIFHYDGDASEVAKLAKLIAEIQFHGENPFAN